MNTSSNPCSREKTFELIGLPNFWINWSPQHCHTWDLQSPHTSYS
jgi:hypothetical protein